MFSAHLSFQYVCSPIDNDYCSAAHWMIYLEIELLDFVFSIIRMLCVVSAFLACLCFVFSSSTLFPFSGFPLLNFFVEGFK